eukprot:scaffold57525_cov63-Attheya_sp.AAC.6
MIAGGVERGTRTEAAMTWDRVTDSTWYIATYNMGRVCVHYIFCLRNKSKAVVASLNQIEYFDLADGDIYCLSSIQ